METSPPQTFLRLTESVGTIKFATVLWFYKKSALLF